MVIKNLSEGSRLYTSNVYLILGDYNTLHDINTLVDVGRDPNLIKKIYGINTGIGKHKIQKVILTHSHYDHAEMLSAIINEFHPASYALSHSIKCVDHIIKNGQRLRLGDRIFEVIKTPGHSNDSLCLYCEEEGVLFAGDTPLIIQSVGGSYEHGYIEAIERLCSLDISTIYFGHGQPMTKNCNETLINTLKNIKKSAMLM